MHRIDCDYVCKLNFISDIKTTNYIYYQPTSKTQICIFMILLFMVNVYFFIMVRMCAFYSELRFFLNTLTHSSSFYPLPNNMPRCYHCVYVFFLLYQDLMMCSEREITFYLC